MALLEGGSSASNGIALLVGAGIVYEITAAACSSPQTTEINASTRAETLMKWVHIGLGQAAVFIAAGMLIDRKHAGAIFTGGALAGVFLYASYLHARAAGLNSNLPGTEQW